ncbi:MAG: 4Fe-4S dicluster domain-containing protein [Pseudomonadota bacterium]
MLRLRHVRGRAASARALDDEEGELLLKRRKCYGCGLCVEACPSGCIEMIVRGSRE